MPDRPVITIQPSKSKKKKERTPAQAAKRSFQINLAREELERGRTASSEFKQYWGQINEIYQSFAGRNASRAEAQKLARSGLSSVGLMKALAKKPTFYKSPIYQSKSRDYTGIAKDLGMPVDRKLVAQAIVNNWDGQSFAEKLREQPQYLASNEFKSTEASLGNIHRSIFGEPDEQSKLFIREAALGRWKPDQFAAALRDDPNYRSSTEFQGKLMEAQSLMGLQPTKNATAPLVPRSGRPNSPRIPGNPNG